MGLSTDLVKVGQHSDLGFGITLPLIGLRIPDRNLTAEEHEKVEYSIKSLYKEFVSKVSLGRKKSFDEIETIAQGRVWSGLDGKKNGLVDEIGGLERAIEVAKIRAGIPLKQEVTLVEMPSKGIFDFSKLMPKLIGIENTSSEDPLIETLKFRLKHNGEPLPILPLEDFGLTLVR